MLLRNWLLTGTSLGLLAFAPLSVQAQENAPAEGLPQRCVDAGFSTLEDCIAAESAAPAPEAAPEPAPEPAPEAVEQAPAPEVVEEPAPAPEPEVIEEPAPEPQPEAAPEPAPEPAPEVVEEPAPAPEMTEEPAAAPPEVVEEPAPEPQPKAAPEPAPEPAPEAVEEPAPTPEAVEEPAPAPAPEAVEAPAPEPQPEVTQEQAPTPAPVEQPAAPTEQAPEPAAEPVPAPAPEAEQPAPVEQPAPEAPAANADIADALRAQVDIYNAAVADLMAGGDAAIAQGQLAAAQAEIDALCVQAGYAGSAQCLADNGLQLPAVPNLPAAAEQPTPAVPPAETPVETPAEALPAEPTEVIENLPEGITQDQIAPVLDSAKDMEVAPVDGQPVPAVEAAPAEPAAPPPASDADAQAQFAAPEEAAIMSANQEQGEAVTVQALEPQQVPQNVTIINQTNVVNTVTNNTTNITNNTQNNTVDNSVTNIDQQNNVQQNNIEQNNIQQGGFGDVLTQVILQVGTQLIVNTPGQDTDRFFDDREDEVFYERLGNGRVRETISRPNGTQIITVRNRNGDILRRSRISPDGRETVLAYFDDRYDNDLLEWRDPGLDLPPLRLNIPVQDYVLDVEDADEGEVEDFFRQPPVEQVARLYSIDEVKRSARVRDSVRKLEVGGLTFDTGAATISRDQVGALSQVATAMLDLLETNPAETFLIEGHTDAVGSDISNLQLSDLRAATVARILADFYEVPPENLATQGYGERYLRIRTDAAERENRRVTIRRITPLITIANN